jgi:hypothetical protein
VRGGPTLGDFGGDSRPIGGARPALKRCDSDGVFDAVAAMGKSWARGCRGLYLKGKGVMRVRDFVLNLISSRIKDPLGVC